MTPEVYGYLRRNLPTRLHPVRSRRPVQDWVALAVGVIFLAAVMVNFEAPPLVAILTAGLVGLAAVRIMER